MTAVIMTRPLVVNELDPNVTKDIVGNKAYNLMVMSSLGLNIPKGFVIAIGVDLEDSKILEEFDIYDMQYPVSVRSGASVSMPGMMDTILNVGVTRENIKELFNDEVLGYDCYRRLIQTMSTSVYSIPPEIFLKVERAANEFYIQDDLTKAQKIADIYEDIFYENTGLSFFSSPEEQLLVAVKAVQQSWFSQRAIEYRKAEDIPDVNGTAIIIQDMVFGNRNIDSGTGVVFSHNPNSGKPGLYGDFLTMAQGEDVVSGFKIPVAIESMMTNKRFRRCGRELQSVMSKLLRHFKTIQDVEFTIDDGTLYILQARKAKCSPRASVRSALNLVNNGAMTISEATDMVIASLPSLKIPSLNLDNSSLTRVGYGLGVSDGEVAGLVAVSREIANQYQAQGEPYIFCAELTSPDDTEVMRHSVGVLTSMGGRLSHAAVLARSMNKPTVVGFSKMKVLEDGVEFDSEYIIHNGAKIKIDGKTGAVYYAFK